MKTVIRSWAAKRSTDRQSLRYAIVRVKSLEQENALLRMNATRDSSIVEKVNGQLRNSEAKNAEQSMKIMNLGADIARNDAWAKVGKVGTITVGVAVLATAIVVVRNEFQRE